MHDMLQRYFGTADLAGIDPAMVPAGTERMLVDLGLETDASRRFALWSMLYMFDAAPDLDVVFKDADERDAARNLMDMMAREGSSPAPD